MTVVTVEKPFLPDTIKVETDVQVSDESIRQSAGVSLNLFWELPNGEERGTRLFICEHCLLGTALDRTWHDKNCLSVIVQKALKENSK